MPDIPVIRIGHLKITDHLVLGITADKIRSGVETLKHCMLEPVLMHGWNQVADALADGGLEGALILAPTAMDLFKSGIPVKLILFTHRSGSILVKNKAAGIRNMRDFKGKIVLIPYQLSVHHMLFHRLLAEVGLKPGTTKDPHADVFLEVMAPTMMPEAIQYDDEGEIGGFIVAEPIGTQAVAAGYGEEVCLSRDLWPGHPCCVLVMRDHVIEEHPEAVQEITNSLVQSGFFMDKNPVEAARIGAGFLSQNEGLIRSVLSDPADRITASELYPRVGDLRIIQDYMIHDMNIMTSSIDMNAFVDSRFAKTAGAK
jgi:NitT/TauT family transport system substrate-binding protein